MADTHPVIEAMARAIYDIHEFKKPWKDAPVWHRICRDEARAALASALDAMMEPSEEVRQAPSKRGQLESVGAGEVWQAMLSQFKKEVLGDG